MLLPFCCRELVKQRVKPHVILRMLGLQDVADTVVGDSMLRGISGGQRKRVTTAEILVGPQSVVLMDEISTGLDRCALPNQVVAWHGPALAHLPLPFQLPTAEACLPPARPPLALHSAAVRPRTACLGPSAWPPRRWTRRL